MSDLQDILTAPRDGSTFTLVIEVGGAAQEVPNVFYAARVFQNLREDGSQRDLLEASFPPGHVIKGWKPSE